MFLIYLFIDLYFLTCLSIYRSIDQTALFGFVIHESQGVIASMVRSPDNRRLMFCSHIKGSLVQWPLIRGTGAAAICFLRVMHTIESICTYLSCRPTNQPSNQPAKLLHLFGNSQSVCSSCGVMAQGVGPRCFPRLACRLGCFRVPIMGTAQQFQPGKSASVVDQSQG